MVGQEELIAKLKSYSIATLPKSLLLVGDDGCGKHLLVGELANHYNVPLLDITKDISYELINDIQLSSVDKFYLVDLNMITEKEQNILLKFIEEPSITTHIFLIANNTSGILDTVLNRCLIYYFAHYTINELKEFLREEDSEDILEYCTTPGQILNLHSNLDNLKSLCDTIVHKLGGSRFDNMLTIADKLNYKDEYDKFDVMLFLKVLSKQYFTYYMDIKNNKVFKLYNIVNEYKKRLLDNRLNKKILIENMLITLWKESRK